MRLEVYRCESCLGIAVVDAEKLMPNRDLPCPYCVNAFRSRISDMVPVPRTLRYPDDFVSTVTIRTSGESHE